jgi:hypothetical protein
MGLPLQENCLLFAAWYYSFDRNLVLACACTGETPVPPFDCELISNHPPHHCHLAAGADLLITTGGMSVDPDDVTRFAIRDLGATDLSYGSPILPGAMVLVGYLPIPEAGLGKPELEKQRTSLVKGQSEAATGNQR